MFYVTNSSHYWRTNVIDKIINRIDGDDGRMTIKFITKSMYIYEWTFKIK